MRNHLDSFVVDWEDNGRRIKAMPNCFVRNEEMYFKEGLTYSLTARGSLGVRVMMKSLFDPSGISIFPQLINLYKLQAILNTHICSYILRAFSSSISFNGGYVSNFPLPSGVTNGSNMLNKAESLASLSTTLKKKIISNNIWEREYEDNINASSSTTKLEQLFSNFLHLINLRCVLLHTIEALTERIISQSYGLSPNEITDVFETTGSPAGWFPLIGGYDIIPKTDIFEIPKEVNEYLKKHDRLKLREEELTQIKSRLRSLYEAGPWAKVEDVIDEEKNSPESDDEGEADSLIGKGIPIPTETFIEELSVKMEIHPISIYCLLKEMREKEGLVCWPEYKRYTEDYFTVMILRMLGFRWPKQIESDEPVPGWADKDGIIPVTEHTEEKILLERIRDRIGAEFGENKISDIESEFADILHNAASKEAEIRGKTLPKKKVTLAQWFENEFFRRHTSQFKKRPIAWHLTSSNGTFQVLMFYHRVSLDMFKNLKNRHLAKVQSYYGTLLERARKGESVPAGLTTGKLSDIELELEEFSNKLDKLIAMPYEPLIDDGVRVNIAPLQKLGLLASPVLAIKDIDRAIADRNRWHEDDKEQVTLWRI
jgi:hypothetical protein